MPSNSSGIGNRLAPPRFLLFAAIVVLATGVSMAFVEWRHGVMIGFDLAAITFLTSCIPLFGHATEAMRATARKNDANRAVLLVLTGAVTAVVMVAIAAEIRPPETARPPLVTLIIVTLALVWLFGNTIYALHYAHLFYTPGCNGKDARGIEVPGADEPNYWDFAYFAFTLGMTFQTSDIEIRDPRIRRVALFHCAAAFAFNIGVLAFTINVLGN